MSHFSVQVGNVHLQVVTVMELFGRKFRGQVISNLILGKNPGISESGNGEAGNGEVLLYSIE